MKTNKNFDAEEFQNRLDLAAAYHLADIYGFSDIIWNHITCRTSSKKNTFFAPLDIHSSPNDPDPENKSSIFDLFI